MKLLHRMHNVSVLCVWVKVTKQHRPVVLAMPVTDLQPGWLSDSASVLCTYTTFNSNTRVAAHLQRLDAMLVLRCIISLATCGAAARTANLGLHRLSSKLPTQSFLVCLRCRS
jgi:hypothetical protein